SDVSELRYRQTSCSVHRVELIPRAMLQYAVFVVILTAFVRPLGGYIERVFTGRPTALDRVCGPIERFIYRAARGDPTREMTAVDYSTSFVLFGLAGTVLLYAILRLQHLQPWFVPEYLTTPLTPDLSLNTAISFSTTTWQALQHRHGRPRHRVRDR